MLRVLFVEIKAFHVFGWAEEVLSDPDLVAGEGRAAEIVRYISADETPHIEYLREAGAEGTLKVKEPKANKKDLYEAALAAAGKSESEDSSRATTAKKKAAKKDDAPQAEKKADDVAPATETAPDSDTDSSGVTTENPVAPAEGADTAAAEAPKADEAGA